MGPAFRPHDSEGFGDVWNKDWEKGEVMRGQIKLSGSGPAATGNGNTVSSSVNGGRSQLHRVSCFVNHLMYPAP